MSELDELQRHVTSARRLATFRETTTRLAAMGAATRAVTVHSERFRLAQETTAVVDELDVIR